MSALRYISMMQLTLAFTILGYPILLLSMIAKQRWSNLPVFSGNFIFVLYLNEQALWSGRHKFKSRHSLLLTG